MAYNRDSRFPPTPKYYRILDPAAYQYDDRKIVQNTAPFLFKSPRGTSSINPFYTHSIHYSKYRKRIPNCSALMSKTPRFPYKSFGPKDMEELLCRCGLNVCECPVEEEMDVETVCQRQVKKRLFKGSTRPLTISNRISNKGYDLPFYDARVKEATEFYRGWKWSQWTSNRTHGSKNKNPGPADYYLEREPTEYEKCIEKLREYRRLNSKQLRFMDLVHRQNILEGKPGPASYNHEFPKSTKLETYGSKADRFPRSAEDDVIYPGPADYLVKRNFDPPQYPDKPCKARLPKPACFGVGASRFTSQKETSPGPADYTVNDKVCNYLHCSAGAFNRTECRFKTPEYTNINENVEQSENKESCPNPSWPFRSRTIRMNALEKKLNEPSPADCLPHNKKVDRSLKLQNLAPFQSSEGRFTEWFNWMPIYGREEIPGPCYYSLERSKCYPAVRQGPLSRSERFPLIHDLNPAPNEYKVGGGLESVLATHNLILKKNIRNQLHFYWQPPEGPKYLSPEERENQIIAKCVALLDYDDDDLLTGYEGYLQEKRKRKARIEKMKKEREQKEAERRKRERRELRIRSRKSEETLRAEERTKEKLLRCFLYKRSVPVYF